MQDRNKVDVFSLFVKLVGVLPLLLALYWIFASGSNSLTLVLFAMSSVAITAYYFSGYSLARWLIGIFAVIYCGLQIYFFYSLVGASGLALIYFISFVVLFVNGLVLLFSKKIADTFAIKRQGLSSASLKQLKLLLWLVIAAFTFFLIRDIVSVLV